MIINRTIVRETKAAFKPTRRIVEKTPRVTNDTNLQIDTKVPSQELQAVPVPQVRKRVQTPKVSAPDISLAAVNKQLDGLHTFYSVKATEQSYLGGVLLALMTVTALVCGSPTAFSYVKGYLFPDPPATKSTLSGDPLPTLGAVRHEAPVRPGVAKASGKPISKVVKSAPAAG